MSNLEDKSGLTDEFTIELNPIGDPVETSPQLPAIPERPADDADIDAWVAYVVALGAGEQFVTADTEHWSSEHGQLMSAPALDKATLIKLADHLKGSLRG